MDERAASRAEFEPALARRWKKSASSNCPMRKFSSNTPTTSNTRRRTIKQIPCAMPGRAICRRRGQIRARRVQVIVERPFAQRGADDVQTPHAAEASKPSSQPGVSTTSLFRMTTHSASAALDALIPRGRAAKIFRVVNHVAFAGSSQKFRGAVRVEPLSTTIIFDGTCWWRRRLSKHWRVKAS